MCIKNKAIVAYEYLSSIIMFIWVISMFFVFTLYFRDIIVELNPILQIGYMLGSVNLIMITLNKNWSFIPIKPIKNKK